MKTIKKALTAATIAVMTLPSSLTAGNDFTIHGKAEFVTDYVWRGAYQGSDLSIQPSLTLGYSGLSLNVWANQSFSGKAKEFDINLGYTYRNFTLTLSDYWWSGVDMPYGHYKHQHFFEGTLAYTFSQEIPLTLSWSTMFAGGDKDADNRLRASTYINAAYPLSLPMDITLTPSIGFTPWTGLYHDKAAITDICLKAAKPLKVTEHFSVPCFLQAIIAPTYDRTYLIAGFSLGF